MKNLSIISQRKYWNDRTNKRNFDHEVVAGFSSQRLSFICKQIDCTTINSAFEVGCGDGFASFYMSKIVNEWRGGDISKAMLDSNPMPSESLIEINAQELPLSDEEFDLVYTWEVLHHLEDPSLAVCEMARVSKKYVVIFEPNNWNLLQIAFGVLVKEERGTLRSSQNRMKEYCRSAGLEVVKIVYCGRFVPNLTPLFIYRVLRKLPFVGSRFFTFSIAVIAKKP